MDNPPEIVIIGDSITHRWGGLPVSRKMEVVGQDSWNDLFGKRAVTNMGFGFDYIENAYFRVQDGELAGCKPRVIVLLIGTNNLGHKMDTPDLCAANFHILVKLIRQKCPESKILICGLLPRREPSLMKLIPQVNAKYAELADGKTVFYADLGADMVGTDGLACPDLLSDSVHPNSKGYKLMGNQLDAALKKIDK